MLSKQYLRTYKSIQIIPRSIVFLFKLKWFSEPQSVQVMLIPIKSDGAISDKPFLLPNKHVYQWNSWSLFSENCLKSLDQQKASVWFRVTAFRIKLWYLTGALTHAKLKA